MAVKSHYDNLTRELLVELLVDRDKEIHDLRNRLAISTSGSFLAELDRQLPPASSDPEVVKK